MVLMIGRRNMLMRPKMAATTTIVPSFFAVESVVRWTPLINRVDIHSATALTASRMRDNSCAASCHVRANPG